MPHLTVRGLPVNISIKTCGNMIKTILRRDKIKKMWVRELSEIHGRYAKLAVLEFSTSIESINALKRLNGLDFIYDGAKYPLSAELEEYSKPTPYYSNNKDNYSEPQTYGSNHNFSVDQSSQDQFIQYPVNQPYQQAIPNLGFRNSQASVPAYVNLYDNQVSQDFGNTSMHQTNYSQQSASHNQSERNDQSFGNTRASREYGNKRDRHDSVNRGRNREASNRGGKRDIGSRGGKQDFGKRGRDRGQSRHFDGRGKGVHSRERERSRSPLSRQDYHTKASKIDMEIEILRKQRMIIEEERRLLLEKKKLELLKECGPQAVLEFEQRGIFDKRRRSPMPVKYNKSPLNKFSEPRGQNRGTPKGHRNDRPQRVDDGPRNPKTRRPNADEQQQGKKQGNNPKKTQGQQIPKDMNNRQFPRTPRQDGVIPKFVVPCRKILHEMHKLIFTQDRTKAQAEKLAKLITLGLRKRLNEVVKDKPYMTSAQIHKLYRSIYALSSDQSVIDSVLKAVKKRREMLKANSEQSQGENKEATDDSNIMLEGDQKEEEIKDFNQSSENLQDKPDAEKDENVVEDKNDEDIKESEVENLKNDILQEIEVKDQKNDQLKDVDTNGQDVQKVETDLGIELETDNNKVIEKQDICNTGSVVAEENNQTENEDLKETVLKDAEENNQTENEELKETVLKDAKDDKIPLNVTLSDSTVTDNVTQAENIKNENIDTTEPQSNEAKASADAENGNIVVEINEIHKETNNDDVVKESSAGEDTDVKETKKEVAKVTVIQDIESEVDNWIEGTEGWEDIGE